MTRRLAVVVDRPLIEPTLADIQAWLRERPATYHQLVSSARVADRWSEVGADVDGLVTWCRDDARRDGHPGDSPGFAYERQEGGWGAEVLGLDLTNDDGNPLVYSTVDEAKAAVDAALTEAGFVLVGSVT